MGDSFLCNTSLGLTNDLNHFNVIISFVFLLFLDLIIDQVHPHRHDHYTIRNGHLYLIQLDVSAIIGQWWCRWHSFITFG